MYLPMMQNSQEQSEVMSPFVSHLLLACSLSKNPFYPPICHCFADKKNRNTRNWTQMQTQEVEQVQFNNFNFNNHTTKRKAYRRWGLGKGQNQM